MKKPVRFCLAALALLLAAQIPNASFAADKKLEVFSWWTSGGEAAALDALFQAVKKADPGVESYPIVLIQRMGIETNSHQCGTIRLGTDPTKSVLDPFCRSHDVPNLFVVDSSFFPSSAAVNPALTIAAQAIRVFDHIQGRIQTATSVHPNLNPVSTTESQLTSQNSRQPSHP
jgi:choline dehydrogenase-like flavoprotein